MTSIVNKPNKGNKIMRMLLLVIMLILATGCATTNSTASNDETPQYTVEPILIGVKVNF